MAKTDADTKIRERFMETFLDRERALRDPMRRGRRSSTKVPEMFEGGRNCGNALQIRRGHDVVRALRSVAVLAIHANIHGRHVERIV